MLQNRTAVATLAIVAAALAIRAAVGLHGYSGQATPPMYGDFEAQRHWMEITSQLPLSHWYQNGTHNNLQYWGLDYPPLTAYHSWLMGKVLAYIEPDAVALDTSHGYESPSHKTFMRGSVLVVDVLLFVPALLLLLHARKQLCIRKPTTLFDLSLILIQPALVLIDHGHFQYNNASLGLTLLALYFSQRAHYALCAASFAAAITYKQMSLYHALPFFFHLLGVSLGQGRYARFLAIATATLATLLLLWGPFLLHRDQHAQPLIYQVLHRVFPVARGLFEDKVANFWCVASLVYKFKHHMETSQMLRLSTLCTLGACLPACIATLRKPTFRTLCLSSTLSALAFFLFSFQVHEKSFLLVALPLSLLIHDHPTVVTLASTVAAFSMFPLLLKDNQLLSYIALQTLHSILAWNRTRSQSPPSPPASFLWALSHLAMFAVHVLHIVWTPPVRYPDAITLLYAIVSFLHFAALYVWLCVQLWKDGELAHNPTKVKTS